MSGTSQHRNARPKRIHRGCLRIVWQRVQDKIGQLMPRQMIFDGRANFGKHQPAGIYACFACCTPKIGNDEIVVAGKPKHAALDRMQQPHPDGKELWRDLVAGVERAKHEALLRQALRCALWNAPGNRLPRVIRKAGMRQMDDLFREKRLVREGQHQWIAENVIEIRSAAAISGRPAVDLNRHRTVRKNRRSRAVRVRHHLDDQIEIETANKLRGRFDPPCADIVELIERRRNALTNSTAVVRRQ
jgi:hypothetical protein